MNTNNDLISRAALLSGFNVRKVTEYDESGCGMDYKAVPLAAIMETPVVDAEPVRHGRWIIVCDTHGVTEDDGWWREWYAKCSECSRMIPLNEYICETQSPEKALTEYPYCHCGAKMDEE